MLNPNIRATIRICFMRERLLGGAFAKDDSVSKMRIASLEFIPVSVPYTHREVSSLVNRDGVTDVIVKATTDDGLVGWGESSSGADVGSVLEALRAMSPFVIGRSP